MTHLYPGEAIIEPYLLSSRVCPTVCLSQADIVSAWLNAECPKNAAGYPRGSSFTTQYISTKFQWDHSQRGREMQVGR